MRAALAVILLTIATQVGAAEYECDITKKLEKGEIDNISGHDYENIKANAIEFQKVMKELIYKNK